VAASIVGFGGVDQIVTSTPAGISLEEFTNGLTKCSAADGRGRQWFVRFGEHAEQLLGGGIDGPTRGRGQVGVQAQRDPIALRRSDPFPGADSQSSLSTGPPPVWAKLGTVSPSGWPGERNQGTFR